MTGQDRLRHAIDRAYDRLRAEVPRGGHGAVLALLRAMDRLPAAAEVEPEGDLVSGRRIPGLGGNLALRLCFDAAIDGPPVSPDVVLVEWADGFLRACDDLAQSEMVLTHCESGFMRLVEDAGGILHAWIATRRLPASWRERADIDWWAGHLARRFAPDARLLQASVPNPATALAVAGSLVESMAYQLGYSPEATIGDVSVQLCRDVLRALIAIGLEARARGDVATPRVQRALAGTVAASLGVDIGRVAAVMDLFVLDAENADWHAAVAGITPAPLVRMAPDQVALSLHGLTTQPLFFLTRELRRRDAQAYHNAAHVREGVFRQDLYDLFADKRFVTATNRIELRRESGTLRTDIDAAIFDRKTGTLGIFELKSQDPFARSVAELTRQRDNLLQANRQVSGILAWIQHNGSDEILNRIDRRTAKTFRVRKVYPFVLGRYLARFNDGPAPDRRAAWGTWPQALRLFAEQSVRVSDANPIASLFSRLTASLDTDWTPADLGSREIMIESTRLVVHPSWAAFQDGTRTTG